VIFEVLISGTHFLNLIIATSTAPCFSHALRKLFKFLSFTATVKKMEENSFGENFSSRSLAAAKGSRKLFSIHLSLRIFKLSTRNLSMYPKSSDIETKAPPLPSRYSLTSANSLSYHKNPINQSDFVYIITLFVAPYVTRCRDLLREI
jgi:hypothetical protein